MPKYRRDACYKRQRALDASGLAEYTADSTLSLNSQRMKTKPYLRVIMEASGIIEIHYMEVEFFMSAGTDQILTSVA